MSLTHVIGQYAGIGSVRTRMGLAAAVRDDRSVAGNRGVRVAENRVDVLLAHVVIDHRRTLGNAGGTAFDHHVEDGLDLVVRTVGALDQAVDLT